MSKPSEPNQPVTKCDINTIIRSILDSTGGSSGEDYFPSLVKSLAQAIGTRWAFIGELNQGGDSIKTLSFWDTDKWLKNFEYNLKGTPCKEAINENVCSYLSNLQIEFPDDRGLVNLGVHSYLGIQLKSSGNKALGVMAVMDSDPISTEIRNDWISVLEIFAERASVEIERKRAEKGKLILEEQLRQAQKMETIGRLAGGVAHDFNNILTSINGYSEMILTTLPSDSPIAPDIEEILKASERAADLTQQLLAFSRKQIISPTILDPNDVLRQSEKILSRIMGESIVVSTEQGEDLWTVLADAGQLNQLLVNLAANALEGMPDGGQFTVKTENVTFQPTTEKDGQSLTTDYVLISVSDNGLGMDDETKEHIFEPFFSTKAVGTRSGMGLATVYGIVDQNHGFIEVESKLGEGTTFNIYLPRQAAKDEPKTHSTRKLPFGEETILLVEDDDMVRALARKILLMQGYQLLEACNGQNACELVEHLDRRIDLLLTDVVMPNMNGKELCEKLRKNRPGLKALYMSGYNDDVIAHHGVLEEGTNFIHKPFNIEAFSKKIREVLDG